VADTHPMAGTAVLVTGRTGGIGKAVGHGDLRDHGLMHASQSLPTLSRV